MYMSLLFYFLLMNLRNSGCILPLSTTEVEEKTLT
jgi:hypothetical protein